MSPNFLGIGVPRGGTTWLYNLLASHPDAYVPSIKKEVHYFDEHYSRGKGWYQGFFPERDVTGKIAIGEVTPHYVYSRDAAHRIRSDPRIRRLILILRDPSERAFSHYLWRIRHDSYTKDFRSFIRDFPNALAWSKYASFLAMYRSLFSDDELLVLIHEFVFADVLAARRRIAAHLNLDPTRFPPNAGLSNVNRAELPRFPRAFRTASRISQMFRDLDLHFVSNFAAKQLRLKHILGRSSANSPVLSSQDRSWFVDQVAADVRAVESQLGVDLSQWRM